MGGFGLDSSGSRQDAVQALVKKVMNLGVSKIQRISQTAEELLVAS